MSVIPCGGVVKTHVSGDIAVHALRGSEPGIHADEMAMMARSECHETSMLNRLQGIDDATSGILGSCDRSAAVKVG